MSCWGVPPLGNVSLDLDELVVTPEGLRITIRRSKGDQQGEGRVIAAGRTGTAICPVTAYETWIAEVGIVEGRAFRSVDWHGLVGKALSTRAVALLCSAGWARRARREIVFRAVSVVGVRDSGSATSGTANCFDPGCRGQAVGRLIGEIMPALNAHLLSVADRIALAKEKTDNVVDHLRASILMHEANAIVVYSPTFADQVPLSASPGAMDSGARLQRLENPLGLHQ
jgi:hypothetical protein